LLGYGEKRVRKIVKVDCGTVAELQVGHVH